MHTQVALSDVSRLIEGTHENPSSVLGPHPIDYRGQSATAVRSFLPEAHAAWIIDPTSGIKRPMRRIHPAGFFEAICDMTIDVPQAGEEDRQRADAARSRYRIQMADKNGEVTDMQDPYAAPSILTEFDRYLLGEGRHHQMYERLGAQVRTVDSVPGVNFSVWAPNARTVQVVGDFNGWDGRQHTARVHPQLGIWELFVPGAKAGDRYKFRILTEHGEWVDKCDPLGFAAELPPLTASVVSDLTKHVWNDDDWMARRRDWNPMHAPMNVYEVHLGSWQLAPGRTHGWLNYHDLAKRLVDYCHRMNFTHVELMPVSEHPFTGSWGYQTVGYLRRPAGMDPPKTSCSLSTTCTKTALAC